jgi:hypothetical protein
VGVRPISHRNLRGPGMCYALQFHERSVLHRVHSTAEASGARDEDVHGVSSGVEVLHTGPFHDPSRGQEGA